MGGGKALQGFNAGFFHTEGSTFCGLGSGIYKGPLSTNLRPQVGGLHWFEFSLVGRTEVKVVSAVREPNGCQKGRVVLP